MIAAVGTFDGVHLGHRFVIDRMKEIAARQGLSTCVYTFTDTPLVTLAPAKAPRQLSTPAEKVRLLEEACVDRCVMRDFGELAPLTAREFIAMLARDGVKVLLIGYDNRFGSDGLVTLEEFREAASGTGVCVEQAPELRTGDGKPLNSTVIRHAIMAGDIIKANKLLGYNYSLTGRVEHGKALGRTIGFPTANVGDVSCRKLIPALGVYACEARVGSRSYRSMVNIGHRPTVAGGESTVTIEAYLVGYEGDLYGKEISLRFERRLRDERRFASLDELKAQLTLDLASVTSPR